MADEVNVAIIPDLRRRRVAIHLDRPEGARVHARIEEAGIEAESGESPLYLEFPDFAAWLPEAPQHYTVTVTLTRTLPSGEEQRERIRFGMGEFTVKDHRFHWNGRPLYLRAISHTLDYPADADAPAMIKEEIRLAREAFFNFIHLHGPIPTASEWLRHADEIGMLAAYHLADWAAFQEVRHLRNHIALAMWTLETSGGEAGALKAIAALRAEDQSRVVLLRDSATGESWYARPFRDKLEPMAWFRAALPTPIASEHETWLRHLGRADMLGLVELIGCGLSDASAAINLEGAEGARAGEIVAAIASAEVQKEIGRLFGGWAGLMAESRSVQFESARLELDAVRINPQLAGYCYQQLCDSIGGRPGILDRLRKPNTVHEIFKRLHAPLRPIIVMQRNSLVPREETAVTVLMANDDKREDQAELMLQVVGPTNQVLWKKKRDLKIPKHGKALWDGNVGASGAPGLHRFVVRLSNKEKTLAEASMPFQVVQPVTSSGVRVNVIDPRGEGRWRDSPWLQQDTLLAPIHLIPPLGNTIRAYPDNDLAQALAQVRGGAVAIVLSPPADWNDLADQIEGLPRATSRPASDAESDALIYARLHPIFQDLPSKCFLRHAYRSLAPSFVFEEESDEDISGALWPTGWTATSPRTGAAILIKRHGSGAIIFTHLRLLDALEEEPIAARLFVNLLKHGAQRAVPSSAPLSLSQRGVEWLRQERNTRVRRWMVCGPFPNATGEGHEAAFRPEQGFEPAVQLPGAYTVLRWQSFFTVADDHGVHALDFRAALESNLQASSSEAPATAYAYAEILADKRQEGLLRVAADGPYKLWINGVQLDGGEAALSGGVRAPVPIKQGRSLVLIKCSTLKGALGFDFDLRPPPRETLSITWWR